MVGVGVGVGEGGVVLEDIVGEGFAVACGGAEDVGVEWCKSGGSGGGGEEGGEGAGCGWTDDVDGEYWRGRGCRRVVWYAQSTKRSMGQATGLWEQNVLGLVSVLVLLGLSTSSSATTFAKPSTARWLVKIIPPYRASGVLPSFPSARRERTVARFSTLDLCSRTGTKVHVYGGFEKYSS